MLGSVDRWVQLVFTTEAQTTGDGGRSGGGAVSDGCGGMAGSLEDAVPAYMAGVPVDPFDEKPLRYRVDESRGLIYSIGPDLTDDGGRWRVAGQGAVSRLRLCAAPAGAARVGGYATGIAAGRRQSRPSIRRSGSGGIGRGRRELLACETK